MTGKRKVNLSHIREHTTEVISGSSGISVGLFWYSERPIWYADAKEHRVLSRAASSFGAAPAREGGPPCGAARRLSRAGMSGTHGTPRAPPPGSVSRAAPACATTFGASLAEGPCRTAAGGGDWPKTSRLAARGTSDGEARGAGARGKPRAGGQADSPHSATGGIPTEPSGAKARRPHVRGLSVRPGAGGASPARRRSTVHVCRILGPQAERTSRGRTSGEGFAPAARCPSAARCEDKPEDLPRTGVRLPRNPARLTAGTQEHPRTGYERHPGKIGIGQDWARARSRRRK